MEPNRVFPAFCFLWSEKIPTLGHNLALVSVLYSSERPEITSHDEESKKAKTTKIKQKETITMKTKLTKTIMSSLAFACALVLPGCRNGAGHVRCRAGDSRFARACSVRRCRACICGPSTGTKTSVGTSYRKPLCKASGSTEMVRRSIHSAL